eukprot:TRINITY_DN8303_c0_g1_i1.p1 TRINITY_DN8303_c0_g1~~TRINITY_DN8303_c0_g1_i1.p1  ORF type:complete len:833 (-),score=227.45 TRINITY_DN8303_c0_g1_i1:32-2500(-)
MGAEDANEILTKVYGFSSSKLKDTLSNQKLVDDLLKIAKLAKFEESGCDKAIGNFLYEVAVSSTSEKHREGLVRLIANGEIKSNVQVAEAIKFLKSVGDKDVDEKSLKEAAGVGVEVTEKDMEDEINKLIAEKEEKEGAAFTDKGKDNLFPLLKVLREKLKWANPKTLKDLLEKRLLEKYGSAEPPKDNKKKAPVKKEKPEAEKGLNLPENVKFYRPEENVQPRPELMEEHLKFTGGRVVTRFPPEPNGYLHIGHAKAMNINFGYAKKEKGWCYLRYDDTNPEKETEEYIREIESNVKWLGHEYFKKTHASEYFEELYQLAIRLIKNGYAYVSHETSVEMREHRAEQKKTGKVIPSKWRDRPIEESVKLFEDMRKGKFREGEAVLRMKQDITSNNPCMWDHVAYRIKYTPHPHVGDAWCIYPSYDYTHCICDSLENITHSMCSLEFGVRRESYDWLLNALDIFRSRQWEYSRMNLTYTVLSKRKLITLVHGNYVNGWDDPRLCTLVGLRRRGFTADAINNFCERIGITRSNNFQEMSLLEECVRQDLDNKSLRAMVVLEPLKVTITNYPADKVEELSMPNHPRFPEKNSHKLFFSRVIYIEKTDFRLEASPTYFRLSPGKEVRLHYGYTITCTSYVKDENGDVTELLCTYDPESISNHKKKKDQGIIHWVGQPKPGEEPLKVEVRLYDYLFTRKFPEGIKEIKKQVKSDKAAAGTEASKPVPKEKAKPKTEFKKKNFLDYLNPNSLKVLPDAYADISVKDVPVETPFQFDRLGYFVVDRDTTPEKIVFNRTVSLKEDKEKNAGVVKEEVYETDSEDESDDDY